MTDQQHAALVSARERLAGLWNAWLYHYEMDKAKALAVMGTDAECEAELERLNGLCRSRLEQWRWSQ